MARIREDSVKIGEVVVRQLRNQWVDVDKRVIMDAVPNALDAIEDGFRNLSDRRFFDGVNVVFSPYISVQWMIFLYRLAREIFLQVGGIKEADQVYYLNKLMHSNDWFYEAKLPIHFLCEHPLGSVLGKADYGDYLFVYQGTTVGGNRTGSVLHYPHMGSNVILFANATVLGNTHIGSNVIVSANTYIINEEIPDNCIVFGQSPNLIIKERTEKEIKNYTKHIWGWE